MTDSKLRLCLAASGGGHVRQILDLEPLWRDYPHVFVTEDTALGRSIAARHQAAFVSHVALGQARLGAPFKMMWGALRNCVEAFGIVRRHRPEVVITTGAGSMFFTILWARLRGAKIVLVDSFARFDHPSAFARLGGPLAHLRIAQAEESARHWPGAVVFNPFRILDVPRPPKKKLLFATVGATLKFERLVDLVLHARKSGLLEGYEVIVQTGEGGLPADPPAGITFHETLPFDDVRQILRDADYVVCHGGTGSLITALREGCRVIAVPRRFALAEHYDDHQAEITDAFRARGLLETADTDAEFAAAFARLAERVPRCATTDPGALIAYLKEYLEAVGSQG
ncbi:MAG: glycosyl transferase family 28 [Sphingobium sp.]|jgi:UDP-N-acetylglucosamine--N-acetylmuramyl-(pentapeptide) pyrophosphoryl-undecaprenol N-acetylglucosamine transferase|nr:glycosyl transferase family 28 [Sphingobium sp.]MCI1271141.1 glycosyl transferase family 28 [Sphingobium sp.]MCI1754607.1 glycosyl transferase family 28 [Sphingobium sp.]MCI2052047.1 glycosyl transferase family 28 [Sphingobium sp.]